MFEAGGSRMGRRGSAVLPAGKEIRRPHPDDNLPVSGHSKGTWTSLSSLKTVSISQNVGMLRWPLPSGTTW